MKTKKILCSALTFGALWGMSACATTHRGTIVMKINETDAHAGIGRGEVSVGDHVQLYHNKCTGSPGRGEVRVCTKDPAGHGDVIQVMNKDYSLVRFPEGTSFFEGDTLEKHMH